MPDTAPSPAPKDPADSYKARVEACLRDNIADNAIDSMIKGGIAGAIEGGRLGAAEGGLFDGVGAVPGALAGGLAFGTIRAAQAGGLDIGATGLQCLAHPEGYRVPK